MHFDVILTDGVKKDIKRYQKKYPSLKDELIALVEDLETNPTQGTPLGKNCYKIRLAIASKNTGKSGGARIITHVKVVNQVVYILTMFDKADMANISDKELFAMLDGLEM